MIYVQLCTNGILKDKYSLCMKRLLLFFKIIYSFYTDCGIRPNLKALQDFITLFNQRKATISTQSFVKFIRFLANSKRSL